MWKSKTRLNSEKEILYRQSQPYRGSWSADTNNCLYPPSLQPVPVARGARIVFVTATVVTLTLCATRQEDVKNVRTASRVETVTMTSTSAMITHVTNTPLATTQLVPSSVSARPDTHSTIQPSVKVCSCRPAPVIRHGGNLMVFDVHAGPRPKQPL